MPVSTPGPSYFRAAAGRRPLSSGRELEKEVSVYKCTYWAWHLHAAKIVNCDAHDGMRPRSCVCCRSEFFGTDQHTNAQQSAAAESVGTEQQSGAAQPAQATSGAGDSPGRRRHRLPTNNICSQVAFFEGASLLQQYIGDDDLSSRRDDSDLFDDEPSIYGTDVSQVVIALLGGTVACLLAGYLGAAADYQPTAISVMASLAFVAVTAANMPMRGPDDDTDAETKEEEEEEKTPLPAEVEDALQPVQPSTMHAVEQMRAGVLQRLASWLASRLASAVGPLRRIVHGMRSRLLSLPCVALLATSAAAAAGLAWASSVLVELAMGSTAASAMGDLIAAPPPAQAAFDLALLCASVQLLDMIIWLGGEQVGGRIRMATTSVIPRCLVAPTAAPIAAAGRAAECVAGAWSTCWSKVGRAVEDGCDALLQPLDRAIKAAVEAVLLRHGEWRRRRRVLHAATAAAAAAGGRSQNRQQQRGAGAEMAAAAAATTTPSALAPAAVTVARCLRAAPRMVLRRLQKSLHALQSALQAAARRLLSALLSFGSMARLSPLKTCVSIVSTAIALDSTVATYGALAQREIALLIAMLHDPSELGANVSLSELEHEAEELLGTEIGGWVELLRTAVAFVGAGATAASTTAAVVKQIKPREYEDGRKKEAERAATQQARRDTERQERQARAEGRGGCSPHRPSRGAGCSLRSSCCSAWVRRRTWFWCSSFRAMPLSRRCLHPATLPARRATLLRLRAGPLRRHHLHPHRRLRHRRLRRRPCRRVRWLRARHLRRRRRRRLPHLRRHLPMC